MAVVSFTQPNAWNMLALGVVVGDHRRAPGRPPLSVVFTQVDGRGGPARIRRRGIGSRARRMSPVVTGSAAILGVSLRRGAPKASLELNGLVWFEGTVTTVVEKGKLTP